MRSKCAEYLETMPLGDDELNEIEEETREQGNDMTGRWLTHRLSRLTSSNFGVVCKMRHTTPVANLVKNLLYCRPSNKAASICWGRENEDNARKAYAEEMSKRGTSVAITKSGLIISSSRQYSGVGRCFSMGGLQFLRTQNSTSSTKHHLVKIKGLKNRGLHQK